MPELAALQESLEQVRAALKEQNDLRAAQNAAIAEQTEKLSEVEKKLPGFVNRRGFVATVAVLIACGLLVAAVVGINHRTVERFESEAIATDQAFCALANNTRSETNNTRAAVRALEAAVRQSFEAVQPSANATPADRARVLEFRQRIIGHLDGVQINGDLALLDCSGIGNGKVDFSVQDAITNLPPPPTTRP